MFFQVAISTIGMVVGRGTWLKISTCGDVYHIHARKVSHTLGNNIQILREILALECGDHQFRVPWPPWPKVRYPWIENDRVPSTDSKIHAKQTGAYELNTVELSVSPSKRDEIVGLILL